MITKSLDGGQWVSVGGESLYFAESPLQRGPGHEYPQMPGVHISQGAVEARHRLLSEDHPPSLQYSHDVVKSDEYRGMPRGDREALPAQRRDEYESAVNQVGGRVVSVSDHKRAPGRVY